jgi:hypothetical protein
MTGFTKKSHIVDGDTTDGEFAAGTNTDGLSGALYFIYEYFVYLQSADTQKE